MCIRYKALPQSNLTFVRTLPSPRSEETHQRLWTALPEGQVKQEQAPLWDTTQSPWVVSPSHLTVFQVAWSNAQSSPSCPPGKVFSSALVSVSSLCFFTEGRKVDVVLPILGHLRSVLNAGEGTRSQQGFCSDPRGELSVPLLFLFSEVCMTSLAGGIRMESQSEV